MMRDRASLSRAMCSSHWKHTKVPLSIYAFTAIWPGLDSMPAFSITPRLEISEGESCIQAEASEDFQGMEGSSGFGEAVARCECHMGAKRFLCRLELSLYWKMSFSWLLQEPFLKDFIQNSSAEAQPCCFPWWFLAPQ